MTDQNDPNHITCIWGFTGDIDGSIKQYDVTFDIINYDHFVNSIVISDTNVIASVEPSGLWATKPVTISVPWGNLEITATNNGPAPITIQGVANSVVLGVGRPEIIRNCTKQTSATYAAEMDVTFHGRESTPGQLHYPVTITSTIK